MENFKDVFKFLIELLKLAGLLTILFFAVKGIIISI